MYGAPHSGVMWTRRPDTVTEASAVRAASMMSSTPFAVPATAFTWSVVSMSTPVAPVTESSSGESPGGSLRR